MTVLRISFTGGACPLECDTPSAGTLPTRAFRPSAIVGCEDRIAQRGSRASGVGGAFPEGGPALVAAHGGRDRVSLLSRCFAEHRLQLDTCFGVEPVTECREDVALDEVVTVCGQTKKEKPSGAPKPPRCLPSQRYRSCTEPTGSTIFTRWPWLSLERVSTSIRSGKRLKPMVMTSPLRRTLSSASRSIGLRFRCASLDLLVYGCARWR